MPKKPQILGSATLAKTRLFHIEQIELRFDNGVETKYERLVASAHGAVLVVPMRDADTALLVREYAAGVDRYELGLPKGRVNGGEAMLEAANRELMEETGYGARRLEHLTSLTLAPGYLSHTTHVILAEDLYPHRRPGDEPEELEVVSWRLGELDRLLAAGECTEARTLAALYIVRDRRTA